MVPPPMPIAVPHPHAIPEFPAVLERSPQLARLSLSRFSHASPELLSKRELLQRVDRKFVVSTSLVRPFLDLLGRTHHLLSQGDEGWARYETCYFDTQKLVSFRDHLRGRRPRFKVRIRHHLGRRKSFLELKTKDAGGRTHKSRRERDFGDTALSPSDLAFLTDAAPTQLGRLQESVWTNFDRATFLGTHEVERITVDCNLAFVRGQREVDAPRSRLLRSSNLA